ncbi:MAG TPA: hypothetical protein DCO89_01530 [Clostridiales bacterium]|nr:hypothetical protein [Clostridiales bacterium]
MNINYELYKSFYAVARFGTLTRASDELFITQSAISQNIKSLEKQLDVVLFERTKKGMKLTEQGQKLYQYVLKGIKSFESAERNINEIKTKTEKQVVNIYSDYTLAKFFLLDKLKFDKNIEYNFKTGIDNKDRFKALSDGILDLLVYKQFDEKLPKEFNYTKISELNYVFFASKNLDVSNKLTKQQLSNYPLISKSFGTRTEINLSKKIANAIKYKCSVDEMVVNLTERGLGIGIAPKEYLDLSKVKIIEIENVDLPKANVFLIYNNDFKLNEIISVK